MSLHFINFADESFKTSQKLACLKFRMFHPKVIIHALNERFFDERLKILNKRTIRDYCMEHSLQGFKHRAKHYYWVWKPLVIHETMRKCKDGDVVVYLDSGICPEAKMDKFVKAAKERNVVGLYGYPDAPPPHGTGLRFFTEKNWTKRDLFIKLDMDAPKYTDTPQVGSGWQAYLVNDTSRAFIKEFVKLAIDPHMITDSPSIVENYEGFREHRHDQSIFSLLMKKYKIEPVDCLKENFIPLTNLHRNRDKI